MEEEMKKFVDELLCKQDNPYDQPKDPRPYQRFRHIRSIVQDRIYNKYKGEKWFQEYRPEVIGAVVEAIVTVLYLQSLEKDSPTYDK